MKFGQLQLKTSLTLVVFLLSALTLAAVGLGWYGQQQTRAELDALISTGVEANTNVKNAYVNALLAVNQIDAAIKVDNPQQRARELEAADRLLDTSRQRLKAFLDGSFGEGTSGDVTKQILRETFGSYWAQAAELRSLADRQDVAAYESLKRGQARNAAKVIDSAFNKFDAYVASSNEALISTIDTRFMQSLYVFGGLIAFAILLALLASLTMSRMVLRPLKRVGAYFEHIAAGDLTQRIEPPSHNEIGMLYFALKRMQDSLGRIVTTVRHGMEQINDGSQHIVAGNTDLSSRTEEQAAALQQTAASMEQLASTVKQNADNARQANQLAATASEVAQRGGHAVGEVVTTMQGISASSRKISEIVGVIDSIAFQTNILALNAAVEAARAGEQGKGFAVVASEVRALAQRSAQAAKEIKGLIDDSVKKVAEGSSQVERAGATMQEIVDSVARVTDIMGEISAATTEQSSGIDQINGAVAQMDLVTQQNAALVQDAATSAASLREQVSHVSDAVSVFKTAEAQVIDVPATQLASTPSRPSLRHGAEGEHRSEGAKNTPETKSLEMKGGGNDIRLPSAQRPAAAQRAGATQRPEATQRAEATPRPEATQPVKATPRPDAAQRPAAQAPLKQSKAGPGGGVAGAVASTATPVKPQTPAGARAATPSPSPSPSSTEAPSTAFAKAAAAATAARLSTNGHRLPSRADYSAASDDDWVEF
ncbi:MAG TPA: methyl-accepting chemotaxis protein [Burkholderiaceae bacterium]|nr:methyl-accepting chemotaxis protein [Burkholderiaceae bacterium]